MTWARDLFWEKDFDWPIGRKDRPLPSPALCDTAVILENTPHDQTTMTSMKRMICLTFREAVPTGAGDDRTWANPADSLPCHSLLTLIVTHTLILTFHSGLHLLQTQLPQRLVSFNVDHAALHRQAGNQSKSARLLPKYCACCDSCFFETSVSLAAKKVFFFKASHTALLTTLHCFFKDTQTTVNSQRL